MTDIYEPKTDWKNPKGFNGEIHLDIRDSTEDWTPYAEPKAPKGSPNILYLVFDDTGFGAWEMFGGRIKMPHLKRIADKGLIYTQFHTTALCSPTRSSLLNGRNATSNGMSCIEEATTGFPGSNGRIPPENAFIAEVLAERGYNTYAIGKWHLLPEEEANMAASKRNWPLGRGFERYYGFLGGETDQWYPDLVYDNHPIEPPYAPPHSRIDSSPHAFHADPGGHEDGAYHLSKDLADKAIQFIQDANVIAPEKPWLLYFSPGANHAPHQVWTGEADKYAKGGKYAKEAGLGDNTGVFDDGYEAYRVDVFEKMKTMGLFTVDDPLLTEINPHGEIDGVDIPNIHGGPDDENGNPTDKVWPGTEYVKPWADAVDTDLGNGVTEADLFIRMAEVYAGYSTYTDAQIGRILDYLEESEQFDNTIIIALADNGASAEGGPTGSVNENKFFNDIADNAEDNVEFLKTLGTDKTYNHYPTGWAWGFDTPFKYWKRWSSYEGGDATPFMISWPAGMNKPEPDGTPGIRKQYIHAVDVVPTLYDCLNDFYGNPKFVEGDVLPPAVVKGYTQNPIEGESFRYSFANPTAPTEKKTQFYSMLGTRGIWHEGWHACTFHPPTPSNWGDFENDKWELYHLEIDPTQSNDLAQTEPKKLNELRKLWDVLATKYKGVPLDDRSTSEVLGTERPQVDESDRSEGYPYYPGCSEVPEAVAANIRTKSYSITATVNDFPVKDPASAKGVMLAHGGRFGGHSLYLDGAGNLCYVYNWLGERQQKVSCSLSSLNETILKPKMKFKVEFTKDRTLSNSGLDQPLFKDFGSSTLGDIQLFVNDAAQTSQTVDLDEDPDGSNPGSFMTQPGKFSLCGEGLTTGRDGGQPVSSDYNTEESKFTGATLKKVVVLPKDDAEALDHTKELKGMLWRD